MLEKITNIFKKEQKSKVILDTNFLMLPGSSGIDIFTQLEKTMYVPYDIYIIENTFTELQKIIDGKTHASGKDKFNAKLGFILAKQKNLKTLKSSSKDAIVDDDVVYYTDENVFVGTLDKKLQQRIREKGGKCITIRNKANLQIL